MAGHFSSVLGDGEDCPQCQRLASLRPKGCGRNVATFKPTVPQVDLHANCRFVSAQDLRCHST